MENRETRFLPLTQIQKLIGRSMLQSKQTKAFGYFSVWTDVTELAAMRKEYSRQTGIRPTTNDLVLCAMARATQPYLQVTGRVEPETGELVIPERFGLGFAVAAPQGLVVPVIQDAGRLTLPEIAQATEDLVRRARANQLRPDDFDGAALVLSGLGMYGIEQFYAIAPPSASSIVSIGYIKDTVVPVGGEPAVRKQLNVSLAIDQCVADELTAAGFLRCIADYLENPWSMVSSAPSPDSQ